VNPHDFLVNLALVLGIASLAAAACRVARQPIIVGYLLAGVAVGPHTPVPLFADVAIVTTLAELGVILLMFCLGVEFSARRVAQVAGRAGPTALVEMTLTAWLGFTVASALGWPTLTCVFAAAMVAISSTMVIARTFEEQEPRGEFIDLVFGVLIFQDLTAVIVITTLTAFATGSAPSTELVGGTLLELGLFLVGVVVIALPIVPRVVRAVARLGSSETTLVFSVGLCFALALLASEAGYSVALGAFVGGSLVAESGEAHRIEALIIPLRDLFSAVFFVAVGMLIDPAAIVDNGLAISLFVAVVVVGKLIGVCTGSLMAGNGLRPSVRAAMSLTQVGEFSFIIVGVGVTHSVVSSDLLAVAVTVSVITTFMTPWMVRASSKAARLVNDRVPRRLATLVTLYGSWLDNLRAGPRTGSSWKNINGSARRVLLDGLCLLALGPAAKVADGYLPTPLILVVSIIIATPFLLALVRNSVKLATSLALEALPPAARDRVDLAATPRRAFTVALQTAVLVIVGMPVLALAQPLVPPWAVVPVLGLLFGTIALVLWRASGNLDGHLQAGAEVVVEALARSLPGETAEPLVQHLNEAESLLPGLGSVTPCRVGDGFWAVGRTLGEIDVHGWCGATAVALQRGRRGVPNPGPEERLEVDDVLVVVGAADVTAATRLLLERGPDERVSSADDEPGPTALGSL